MRANTAVARYLAIGLVAVAAAGISGAYAFGRILEGRRPDLALKVAPTLPPALTTQADFLLAQHATRRGPPPIAEVRSLATRALRSSALDARALRLLASTMTQSPDRAYALLTAAFRVSRRDIGAHLVKIEFEVARNNVPAILRHYDQAITINPSIGPALFPILLGAISDPPILREARRVVSRGPTWLPLLLNWASENPEHLPRVAPLVGAIPRGSEALLPGYGQAVVEGLVRQKAYRAAFAVHRRYAAQSASTRFTGGFTYRPIDWALAEEEGVNVSVTEGGAPVVHLLTDPNVDASFLSRLTALAPGNYRIAVAGRMLEGEGRLRIGATCVSATGEERALSQSESPLARGSAEHGFTVPAACPFQWGRLSAKAGANGLTAAIEQIRITPAGRR